MDPPPKKRWADLTDDEQNFLNETPGEIAAAAPGESARDLLDKLMPALNPDEQALIRWLDLEQKNIAEVCALTGWNSGVTRIRAFRARAKLKAAWRKMEKSRP